MAEGKDLELDDAEAVSNEDGRGPAKRARKALRRGDLAKAVTHFQAATAKRPKNAEMQLRLGRALLKLDRVAEADAAFRRALEIDPENDKAQAAIARTAWEQGRRTEAVAHLEAAAARAPGNTNLQLQLGEKLLGQLQIDAAAEAFRGVLAAEPRNGAALKGLAQAAAYAGEKEEALCALRAALEVEPGDARVLDQIRRLEGGLGEYDWKAEIRDALTALTAEDGARARRIWGAQVLLAYGMTGPVERVLRPMEDSSTPARRLLQMARQLDRMGLSNSASSPADLQDPETDQLNGLQGYTEKFQPNADTLVLVFSGNANRAFLSIDLMHRVLRKTGASLVYLRDVNRSLYFAGIVGLSDDFPGTIAAFHSMMERSGARRLLLIGHCGGASAALRFGLALGAEGVLGIAPRILGGAFLDKRPQRNASRREEVRQSVGAFAGDIPTLYRDADSPPKVTLLAGAGMEPEGSFSREMAAKVPNVAYAEIPGGRKDCLGVVLARGLLSPLFASFVSHGEVDGELLQVISQAESGVAATAPSGAPMVQESALSATR